MLSMKQLEVPMVREMYALAERLVADEKPSELVEPDSIPSDAYRQRTVKALLRLGLIECTGGPYFFDMIPYAPSLRAAEALAHIATEEIGHGRMLLECLEPFGVEYEDLARDQFATGAQARMSAVALADPSVYGARSWEDVLAITMLIDPAGILLVGARVLSNYGPLARVGAATLIEERGHAAYWEVWGKDVFASAEGCAELQRSIDKIYPIAMGSLGRAESINPEFRVEREMGIWRVDPAELQQTLREMLEITLPAVGLQIPDSDPDYSNAFW